VVPRVPGVVESVSVNLGQSVKKGQLLVTAYQDNKGQAVGSIDLAVKMVKKQPYDAELTIPYQQITKDNYQAFLNP